MTRYRVSVVGLWLSLVLFVVWYLSLICWFGGRYLSVQFTCTSGNAFITTDPSGLGGPPWVNGWHWKWPWHSRHSMGSAGWLPHIGCSLGNAVQVPLWMPAFGIGALSSFAWRYARRHLLVRTRARSQLYSGHIATAAVVGGVGMFSLGILYPPELIVYALGGMSFMLVFSAPMGTALGDLWHYNDEHPGQVCSTCRYDLTGNELGVCPECGTPIVVGDTPSAPNESGQPQRRERQSPTT